MGLGVEVETPGFSPAVWVPIARRARHSAHRVLSALSVWRSPDGLWGFMCLKPAAILTVVC